MTKPPSQLVFFLASCCIGGLLSVGLLVTFGVLSIQEPVRPLHPNELASSFVSGSVPRAKFHGLNSTNSAMERRLERWIQTPWSSYRIPELRLMRVWSLNKRSSQLRHRFDPSGLSAGPGGKLYTVDDKQNTGIVFRLDGVLSLPPKTSPSSKLRSGQQSLWRSHGTQASLTSKPRSGYQPLIRQKASTRPTSKATPFLQPIQQGHRVGKSMLSPPKASPARSSRTSPVLGSRRAKPEAFANVRVALRSDFRVSGKEYALSWKMNQRLDLEGLAWCDGVFLAVAEQARKILRIAPSGKTTAHPLAIQAYESRTARHKPMARFSKNPNAAYEGIACDSKSRRLFVIQERQPRMVLVVAWPQTWKDKQPLEIIDHFDLPSFGFPKTIGKYDCEPDFAGATFVDGFLYLIYRNARLILKVEPGTKRLAGVWSYLAAETGLFLSSKPFGFAEGIAILKGRLWLILDNNGRRRQRRPKDGRAVLLEFELPERKVSP